MTDPEKTSDVLEMVNKRLKLTQSIITSHYEGIREHTNDNTTYEMGSLDDILGLGLVERLLTTYDNYAQDLGEARNEMKNAFKVDPDDTPDDARTRAYWLRTLDDAMEKFMWTMEKTRVKTKRSVDVLSDSVYQYKNDGDEDMEYMVRTVTDHCEMKRTEDLVKEIVKEHHKKH